LRFTGETAGYAGLPPHFLENAPRVQQALEAYAAKNQGMFPPDAIHNQRPQGLSDSFLHWKRQWNIDYDVHDNGNGGKFICLEWCGPYTTPEYLGLCQKPELRRKYSRGQAIPDQINRIWVIRESAKVLPVKRQTKDKK
jgi:hypothetical protein